MKIGYARVSTVGQDLESQENLLMEYGCERIFVEKVTGTSTAQRKALQDLFDKIREGDEVYVTKIDRLARSIIDLNKIVSDLNEMGVSVYFIKDNLEFQAGDEGNSMQRLMFNVLGSFAQFERDLIVERTTEGRERAKAQGKHLGRKGKAEKDVKKAIRLYKERDQNGMSVTDISKLTGVPRSTIYVKVKEYKE
ncbi:recombinase family protein [Pontibacillus yanchengensis]|uniref:Recombinase family protein n=1 Tax=Pontibacillus yanchengensis TaxID=462910 RepID=A0A6I5A6T5_9BACI|nr:recombinase family protein [Pontibacillus yanchengensis]MYL36033.1 recombinase family protein [Pontibacillus yanchengensis]